MSMFLTQREMLLHFDKLKRKQNTNTSTQHNPKKAPIELGSPEPDKDLQRTAKEVMHHWKESGTQ